MIKRNINGTEITFEVNNRGKVMWCSDWSAIFAAADKAHPELELKFGGPNTYGHVDVVFTGSAVTV